MFRLIMLGTATAYMCSFAQAAYLEVAVLRKLCNDANAGLPPVAADPFSLSRFVQKCLQTQELHARLEATGHARYSKEYVATSSIVKTLLGLLHIFPNAVGA